MGASENTNIRIAVSDEQDLYTPLSPEDEFNDTIKTYIKSKIHDKHKLKGLTLTVVSEEPIDEARFRAAVSNWIKDEKIRFKADEKHTLITLISLLIFGSLMLIICLSLEKDISVLKYSLMPIMGSLALSKAAGIMVIDIPAARAQKWLLDGIDRHNIISFEYGNDNSSISCKENKNGQE